MVFDKLIRVLVFGCGYRRVEDASCSATTLRRRRDAWIALGLGERLHLLVLSASDRMIGLALDNVAVDGCSTKAPCGGQLAGRSPVDRGTQGLKRSLATEARGVPLAAVPAPAHRHDSPLLAPTLDAALATLPTLGPLPTDITVALDAAYDSDTTRATLAERDLQGQLAHKGTPGPDPGHQPVAGEAHLRLGQPVRQAVLVHRTHQAGRGVLDLSGPRDHHVGSAAPPGWTC